MSIRFWANVDIREPDECWEWRGGRNKRGYGCVQWRDHPRRFAHRLAWSLVNGEIPSGLNILHSCDNPPCCNPRHLRTGTQQDNVNDMIERGRQPLGSDRGNSKLSASDVLEIRRLCAEGYVQREVAERFGINQSVVSQIVTRQIWTHV